MKVKIIMLPEENNRSVDTSHVFWGAQKYFDRLKKDVNSDRR